MNMIEAKNELETPSNQEEVGMEHPQRLLNPIGIGN